MPRRQRYLLGLALALALALLAVMALRWGLAGVAVWRASESLRDLHASERDEPAQRDLVLHGMAQLERAERLAGRQPDVPGLRGRLYYWQAMNLASAGLERGALLDRAVAQYRQALALRPAWPYFWSNLAVAKAERGAFDPEFRRAVRRAVETGPWEPEIQLQLLRVDFLEQERIDRRSRERIDGMLDRALVIQPGEVMALAATFNQLPRVCARAVDERLLLRCRQLGWRPAAPAQG